MTVFVVSLFLPYTVDFDANRADLVDNKDPSLPDDRDGSATDGYFSLPPTTFNISPMVKIPMTPGATTATEKIFVPQSTGSSIKVQLPTSSSATSLRSLMRPEQQSSSWEMNSNVKQFISRAKSLSSPSLTRLNSSQSLEENEKKFHSSTASSSGQFSKLNLDITLNVLGNGGLVSAVDAASDRGLLKDKTWVGTLGMPTDMLEVATTSDISERLANYFESLVVWIEDKDFREHYEHYCKTILWPMFHYQIPDNPKSRAYEDHSWISYVRVNQAFANQIVQNWKRGDIVWIHDYHLLLVPGMIRKQLPDAEIGFYLHTAFPSSEIFRCLAVRAELLDGVLGANMIGFQAEEYCSHFLQTCSRLLNVEATKQCVILEDGRVVHVGQFPIGVDLPTIDDRRRHQDVKKWMDVVSEKYSGKKLIVARDKLDTVRGVRQKLLAYEVFLDTCPEYKDDVVFIQVATSTTEDSELSSAVNDIVERINSTHSTLAHQPLVFLKQDIEYSQWLGLIMVADGLMITSLREGMNLTGHEFIHCQDGKFGVNKYSPLILSEFTGSAALLKNSVLQVNPWDYRQCANAIKLALDMSMDERMSRWARIHDKIVKYDAIHWFQTYMGALDRAFKDHALRDVTSVPRLDFGLLLQKYDSATSRLFILDFEGTLAAWGSPKDVLLTTPTKSTDILNDLIEDQRNTVFVMSARRPDEMELMFRLVPGVGMIAENGAYLLKPGSIGWISLVDADHIAKWKIGVRSILEYYQERIEESKIDESESALILSYAAASDKQAAFKQAGECANHINDAALDLRIRALPIDDGIYVSDADVNKSSATQIIGDEILERCAAEPALLPEFLLVIGDSREDEYVFEWAQRMEKQGIRDVTTVTVGQRNTVASCTLSHGVAGVLSTLRKLVSQQEPDRRKLSAYPTHSKHVDKHSFESTRPHSM